MGFDTERFYLQQLAGARHDSTLPSDLWMDRCCRRLRKHVPDIAPDGVVALAHGLWLSHWFDNPEATADEAAYTSPFERYAAPGSTKSTGDERIG